MIKVMVTFGTRPEAIKMAPVVKALEKEPSIETIVFTTGQHKGMLDQVLEKFEITPKYKLDIMKQAQTISYINSEILRQADEIIGREKPDVLLVHGDTTTSLACAQVAFYNKISVGHVEAGLRTNNKYSPFPEEMNRVLISKLADYHFAPTKVNYRNLKNEGISEKQIFLVGNTAIDATKYTASKDYVFKNKTLKSEDFPGEIKYILMTAHRRENWGEPMENIFNAVNELAKKRKDIKIFYPVHPNPAVKGPAQKILTEENIVLLDPLDVFDMHNLILRSHLILTDSGGLQEEGPAFKKPVLVMRENTERPEAVEAGVAKLVGTDFEKIISEVERLLDDETEYDKMKNSKNPYGDGRTSEKIVDILKKKL